MTTAIEQVEEKALSVPDQAKAFTVNSNDDYMAGESLLASCKEMENEIHAAFDGIVEKAYQAHKEAVAKRKSFLDPIEAGRKILKHKMIAYQDQQEKLRREEQRRIEAEAKARAEQEALDAAVAAEQSGDKEAAEAIMSDPVYVPPVMVAKTAPAASRLSAGREVWSVEVINLMELCKAIVAGKASITLIQANQVTLNNMAKAMKSTLAIPGVRAVSRKV